MKKLIYSLILVCASAVIISGCQTAKTASGSSISRSKFTGTWTVSSVSFEGLLENAVQSAFDQAKPKEFEGSTWILTNSGNGSYTLLNGTSQSIFWSFNTQTAGAPVFQFKKVYQGEKAQDITSGYQLEVSSADGNAMTLRSPVDNNGSRGYIVYSFVKK